MAETHPDPKLRLWSMSLSYRRGGSYRTNRTVNVAAPDIVTAIQAAVYEMEQLDDVSDLFVNSAAHRGAVHLLRGWAE